MDGGRRKRSNCRNILVSNGLVLLTLSGVCVGLATGFGVRTSKPNDEIIMWIGMAGELYMRILKMMIVPLIVTSIISVTASMDPKSNGKISGVCLAYTLICNFLPGILGCILCVAIGPGYSISGDVSVEQISPNKTLIGTGDIMADLLRNIFPDNIVEAAFQQTQTTYSKEYSYVEEMIENTTSTKSIETRNRRIGSVNSPNILGLVIICTVFGIASGYRKDISKPFQLFFHAASEVILQALRWVMWFTPIGVASLVAKTICSAEDIALDFQKLAMFIVTTVGALLICGAVVPIAYVIVRRSNPFPFLLSLSQPITLTFATASTPITMPELMARLENNNGIDKRICRFVIPFSLTLGRSGTALYIATSSVFVCQMVGINLNAANITMICLLTTIGATGAPPVPSSALMTVIIILAALNIPSEAVTLLYTFDWFLDRVRSIVNLLYQAFSAILTQELCGCSLSEDDVDSYDKLQKDLPEILSSVEINIEETESPGPTSSSCGTRNT